MSKVFAPSDIHIATALRNLALVYQRQKDYRTAGPLLDKALAIVEHSRAPDRKQQLVQLLNDIGYNYQCLGQTADAQAIAKRLRLLKSK